MECIHIVGFLNLIKDDLEICDFKRILITCYDNERNFKVDCELFFKMVKLFR